MEEGQEPMFQRRQVLTSLIKRQRPIIQVYRVECRAVIPEVHVRLIVSP